MEETYFFYLVDLLPVLIPTFMQNLKIICQGQGEVCKIDKLPNLSIKTLKNITPEKDGNGIFFPNLKYLYLLTNWLAYLYGRIQSPRPDVMPDRREGISRAAGFVFACIDMQTS